MVYTLNMRMIIKLADMITSARVLIKNERDNMPNDEKQSNQTNNEDYSDYICRTAFINFQKGNMLTGFAYTIAFFCGGILIDIIVGINKLHTEKPQKDEPNPFQNLVSLDNLDEIINKTEQLRTVEPDGNARHKTSQRLSNILEDASKANSIAEDQLEKDKSDDTQSISTGLGNENK